MTALTILLASIPLGATLYLVHRQKSIAERVVDALYWLSLRLSAFAGAVDTALLYYRIFKTREEGRHIPLYRDRRMEVD